jgi:outer membrane protein assembly factor BamB
VSRHFILSLALVAGLGAMSVRAAQDTTPQEPPATRAPASPAAGRSLPKTTLPVTTGKSKRSTETLVLEPILKVNLDASPSAAAAFDERTAYVPLKSGRVAAIDLVRGHVRWVVELTTTLPAAVSDGLIVVAGDDRLTGLDAATGIARWSVAVAGGFSAPPLADTGWVLAAATGGDVLAIRASDGHVLWTHALGASVRARPAIAADAAYFSLDDGRVVSLALLTGAPRWERLQPGKPADLLVLDDRLFFGAEDKFFYCLNTKNGDQRWRWRTGGKPAGPPAIDEKRVYYVALDNILWVLNRGNGVMQWREPLPVRPSGGPLVMGGVVVVAGLAFEIYGYRVESGEAAGNVVLPADLAAPVQVLPGPVVALATIAMFTREGEFQVLKRRLEPVTIPMPYPLGEEIPLAALVAPPGA